MREIIAVVAVLVWVTHTVWLCVLSGRCYAAKDYYRSIDLNLQIVTGNLVFLAFVFAFQALK